MHNVNLLAYRIGETEVTQELYKAVIGHNPARQSMNPENGEVQEKRPVENANWIACIYYYNEHYKKVMSESDCVYYADKELTKVYSVLNAGKKKFLIGISFRIAVFNLSNVQKIH